MPRIVKRREERLDEFLSIAGEMFVSVGYEATTIQMILDRMGVSKGSFYHYFKSKESLLDKMVERFSEVAIGGVGDLLEQKSLSAVEKLREFLMTILKLKFADSGGAISMIRFLDGERNLRFKHKFNSAVMRDLRPMLDAFICREEGEGVFRVSNSESAAEIVITLMLYYGEVISSPLQYISNEQERDEIVTRRVEALVYSVARILGIEDPGKIRPDKESLRRFARDLGEGIPS